MKVFKRRLLPRSDIRIWIEFLEHFNGKVMVLPEVWTSSDVLHLFSDASGLGFASVWGSHWIQGPFLQNWDRVNIAVKELLPIVLAVHQWGPQMTNTRILFMCDNESVVFCLNNQTSKDDMLMTLLRKLVLAALKFNIVFRAKHIPGKCNVVCDALSHFQLQKARAWAPWLETKPQEIVADWCSWFS